eukprot:COSAG01_NODE_335_length_18690_cov_7.693185_12_plen_247_part_00
MVRRPSPQPAPRRRANGRRQLTATEYCGACSAVGPPLRLVWLSVQLRTSNDAQGLTTHVPPSHALTRPAVPDQVARAGSGRRDGTRQAAQHLRGRPPALVAGTPRIVELGHESGAAVVTHRSSVRHLAAPATAILRRLTHFMSVVSEPRCARTQWSGAPPQPPALITKQRQGTDAAAAPGCACAVFHLSPVGPDLIDRMHADPCAPGCALAVSSPQHERHAASRRGSHSSIAASAEPIGSQVSQPP